MQNNTHVRTAEFVSPKHPDKICDYIADTLLDIYTKENEASRVAVEVMGGHNLITLNGEVTSTANPPVEEIVKNIVGDNVRVVSNIAQQSPEIARGVDVGGAGDQGIMNGYACAETDTFMPREYELARTLCMEVFAQYPFDGKTQVTLEGDRVKTVVASFQHADSASLRKLVEQIISADEYLINPSGEWKQGGFDADAGLSGRKIVVDNYGPNVPVGGGSFSGKDYTKVDRSAAYMARRIAVEYLHAYEAREVFTRIAYAIGKPEPVMAVAFVDGKEVPIEGYDLSPKGIQESLALNSVQFTQTAQWGHFGRGFSWDQPARKN